MMVAALYIVTLMSSCLAALWFVFGFIGAKSAPQEAATAAGAIALAVIPYVFTRCVQLSNDYLQRRKHERKVIALLEESNEIAKGSK